MVLLWSNLEFNNWFIIRYNPIKNSRSISDIPHSKHHIHMATIQATNTWSWDKQDKIKCNHTRMNRLLIEILTSRFHVNGSGLGWPTKKNDARNQRQKGRHFHRRRQSDVETTSSFFPRLRNPRRARPWQPPKFCPRFTKIFEYSCISKAGNK